MVKTEKCVDGGALWCGMLFRKFEDYNFFRTYFTNNHLYLTSCNNLRMNTKETLINKSTNMFSPEGGFFKYVVYYSLGTIAFIIVVGLLLEGKRFYTRLDTSKHDDKI